MKGEPSILSFLEKETRIGDYTIGDTIGQGTFGKVKQATHIPTGAKLAVKIVDRIYAPAVEREIETWRHLHHPNIAQLYEVILTEDKIYMVTELCEGGEAFDYICQHGKLDDTHLNTKKLFKQIVSAVAYCHQHQFVHRDLKLENILFTMNLQVKIIDFGFTRKTNTNKLLETYCGSMAYAAPEIVSGEKYVGPQVDIWSLGIILYTLLCGYLPFDDDNEAVAQKMILSLNYEIPDFLSPDSRDLISKILQLDGNHRLSIQDILAHPWFHSLDPHDAVIASCPTTRPTFGTLPGELELLNILYDMGFDVKKMIHSVQHDMCDSLSALWYLLYERFDPASMKKLKISDTCQTTTQHELWGIGLYRDGSSGKICFSLENVKSPPQTATSFADVPSRLSIEKRVLQQPTRPKSSGTRRVLQSVDPFAASSFNRFSRRASAPVTHVSSPFTSHPSALSSNTTSSHNSTDILEEEEF